MSHSRKPTTIAATIALFRDQAPPKVKANDAVLKYVMKFFETGVLSGIALAFDIERLPESEREAAAKALHIEFQSIVLTNLLNTLNAMPDNAKPPQARSGQYRATPSQFVPADSGDGTPESNAYEDIIAKLAASFNKPKSDCPPPQESPQAREIVPSEAREIVKGEGKSSDAKGGV